MHAALHSFRHSSISHFSHLQCRLSGRQKPIGIHYIEHHPDFSWTVASDSDQLSSEIQSLRSNTVQGEQREIRILDH